LGVDWDLGKLHMMGSMPITEGEQKAVMYSLRHARGRYLTERAGQLSGIPRSTLYEWRRKGVYLPDFDQADPIAWSYRDLVFLRLLGWLRQLGMPRTIASEQVGEVKDRIAQGAQIQKIGASKFTLVIDDGLTQLGEQNLLPFEDFQSLLSTFDLLEPIEELRRPGRNRLWAPNLVTPSPHTFISPWVLGGDPCVDETRIPTASIYALREERGLSTRKIVALYPGLKDDAAEDAYRLERRLRGFELPSIAAA
jgi:uncharacterized protein (DUF433 family)